MEVFEDQLLAMVEYDGPMMYSLNLKPNGRNYTVFIGNRNSCDMIAWSIVIGLRVLVGRMYPLRILMISIRQNRGMMEIIVGWLSTQLKPPTRSRKYLSLIHVD